MEGNNITVDKVVQTIKRAIFVLFVTILLCSNTIKAQRLYSESGDFYEKSKRSVVDHAKLGVFYELKFRKDSTKLNDYTEAQTVLMVSDKQIGRASCRERV